MRAHHAARWLVVVTRPSRIPAGSVGSPSLSCVPLLFGVLGAPATNRVAPVHADELADAKAKQAALAKQITDQKAAVAQITALQSDLSRQITATKQELSGSTPTSRRSASRST